MPEPREINQAVKQGLDVLFEGSAAGAYDQPPQSAQDLLDRGLIDPAGKATSKGILFTDLQDAGAFYPDGTITPRASAWAMPYEQVLQPENLNAFKIRERDGIDDSSPSFGEIAGGIGEFLWDAGAGALKSIGSDLQVYSTGITDPFQSQDSTAKIKREKALATTAISEGVIHSTKELAGLLGIGSDWASVQLAPLVGAEESADDQLWESRQGLARTRYQNSTAKVGETIEKTGLFANAVENAAQVKSEMKSADYASLVKQSGAVGQMLDPTILIPAGVGAKVGKLGVITRAGIKADEVLTRVAAMDATIARQSVALSAAQKAAVTAKNAAEISGKFAEDIGARLDATGNQALLKPVQTAQQIATMSAAKLADHTAQISKIAPELETLTTLRNSLATRIPENVAAATQRAIQIGSEVKAVPVRVAGALSETLGIGLVKLDNNLTKVATEFGLQNAYGLLRSGVGFAGYSVGLFPGFAAAGSILGSGAAIESTGKFARVVGSELTKARGQVPFWQRVANYSELSPVHRATAHLVDTATLGGAVPATIRSAAKGTAAAYPVDLLFEYLADGGDPNADTFKRAAAQAMVIGGSSGALGGMMQGTKARHRELALGDELNFRADIINPVQKQIFDGMKQGTRRAIATYAATNPQIRFNFVESGSSSFDRATNTATINTRSTNPIKPLIAHEVLHHVAIRNQMEGGISALLVGDGEAGGLLRANDGALHEDFRKFWDAYNARNVAAGNQPIGLNDAALEYYIDSAADHVSEIAESGELGAIGGRTKARRMIQSLVEATLPKIPLIRDMHFKTGGLMEQDGRMVMGNGLLSEGIRELPQVRAMTRQMLKNSSGRPQGGFSPLGSRDTGGVVIPVQKGDKAVLDKMISIFETEEINGQTRVKYDKDGDPIPLSPAKDLQRASIGHVIREAVAKQQAEGRQFAPEEIKVTPDGDLIGNHLGEGTLRMLREKGILNAEQMRILRGVNGAVKNFKGDRFTVINHPATKKVGKKVKYATLKPTLRDVVPVAMSITKDGNLRVGLMSVTQLESNIQTRAATKRGQSLYNGNMEAIKADVSEVMQLHRQGKRTDAFFDEKYGAVKGREYKNFINTVFGEMTSSQKTGVSKTGQRWEANPIFGETNLSKENVYKTYRIDRISQATKMTGEFVPMPFVYDSVKLNLMPNGLPTLDSNGTPIVKSSLSQNNLQKQGYVFHRGKDPSSSRDIVQFADDPTGIESYGDKQYAVKKSSLKKIPKYVENFTNSYFKDEVKSGAIPPEVNPENIVESAGVWDNRQFVSDLWQKFGDRFERDGVIGFQTNDGAVIFPGYGEDHGIIKVVEDDNAETPVAKPTP